MYPRLKLLSALGVLAACAWTASLPAATFTVTTPAELQAALTTAAGNRQDDVIEVAAGTYPLSSTLTYAQDFSESLTIVGADPATTIIDGGGAVQVMSILAGGAIEVRNLTFRSGRNNGPGGGLYAYSFGAGIKVLNSRFVENSAISNGGGLWARTKLAASGNVVVEDSLFEGNRAQGEVSAGGGAYIRVPSDAVVGITDSRFVGNVTTGAGGGLRIEGPGPIDILPAAGRAVLTRTDFVGNSAGLSANWPGGGASIAASEMNLLDLELYDNRASEGGGLYLQHFTRLYVTNSVFKGNDATLGNGGGLATADVLFATVDLFHNTLFGNRADGTGGGAFLFVPGSTSRSRVINNIIWGNSAINTADLYVDNQFFSGDVGATVALIGNNASTMTVECIDPGLGCTVTRDGNIDVDPMLLDAEGADFDAHLLPGSPMIDAGVDTGYEGMPPWDFDGPGVDARIIGVRPDIGADEFSGEVPPPAGADLAVTLTDQPDPVPAGGLLTYTMIVTNAGPDAAVAVTLKGLLPQGVSRVELDASQGECELIQDALDCGLGGLASGASATVTLVVNVTADGGATLSYAVSVDAATADPNAGNDAATATTQVTALRADLSVSASVTPTAPQVGETATFTVTVANAGPDGETAATVDLTLPLAAGVQSVTPAQGTCKLTSGGRYCLLGALAAGAQTTVTVTMRPTAVGTLVLGAVAGGDLADDNLANNSVTRATQVTDTVEVVVKGKGGGGSFGWLELLGLAGLLLARFGRRARDAVSLASLLLVVSLAGVPVAASADDAGWYAGASLGASSADYGSSDLARDLDKRGWTILDPRTDDSDTFWKAYVGYQVNSFIAVEVGYADLGEVETSYRAILPPGELSDLLEDTLAVHPYLGSGWTASGLLSGSFADDAFAVFARAGVFVWEADIEVKVVSGGTGKRKGDESGTDAMFGVGFDWRINPAWVVRVEWERYKLNDWVDVPSAGIVWRFR
jgi:uncharacterized repeat protein (TIGR01451 family)